MAILGGGGCHWSPATLGRGGGTCVVDGEFIKHSGNRRYRSIVFIFDKGLRILNELIHLYYSTEFNVIRESKSMKIGTKLYNYAPPPVLLS